MLKNPLQPRKAFDLRYVRDEKRRSYRMALILFGSLLLYFFFSNFVIGLGVLSERSMLPTMSDGDTYLVNKYIYHLRSPQRGEIIVLRPFFNAPDQYVKRVVGLPGDTLAIRSGRLWVNNQKQDEPYCIGPTLPNTEAFVVGKNTFFVLGDNRMESEDSRKFGAVKRKDILGMIAPGRLFAFK